MTRTPPGLTGAWPPPADLSNAARTGHDASGAGKLGDICGELTSLVLAPVKRPLFLEQEGFNNCEHGLTIRLRSIIVQMVDSWA